MLSPPANKGLLSLADKSLFSRSLRLVALRVPSVACNKAMKMLPPHLLDIPRHKSIVPDPAANSPSNKGNTKLVLLNPSISSPTSFPPVVSEFASTYNAEVVENHELVLDYSYWTADQIIRSILPDSLNVPSSFELIGHIAHMNLRKEYLPYKKIVGEVILDKNQYVRTVVNKTDSIDHTFRYFKMEILAGEEDMLAEVKESNCKFRFDFSRVYWNSCLQTEHDRLVSLFGLGDTVCDVMAGVGPFALPAAKNRRCTVFANDLNPDSFKYLSENIASNKLSHLVRAYNMDGRRFVWASLEDLNRGEILDEMKKKTPNPVQHRKHGAKNESQKLPATIPGSEQDKKLPSSASEDATKDPKNQKFKIFSHYVMNLPASALEFLDAFRGLFFGRENVVPPLELPVIHCYCFSTAVENFEADVLSRAQEHIGCKIPSENVLNIHRVRDVAPKKEMLCISFRLPSEVAYAEPFFKNEKRKIDEIQ